MSMPDSAAPAAPLERAYETILLERPEPHLLLVTLHRPDAANAMNTQMGVDLHEVFLNLVLDPGDVRCVVITGHGKHFCAGGDLKQRRGMTDAQWRKQHVQFEQTFFRLLHCPMPVIAAVNGAAFGGGTELTLMCDFAYAAESARFALTETRLGIMPGGGGTQNLARAVGTRRAKELIFSARPFSAAEALDWGMLNRVLPDDELMPAVLETAGQICANGPLSVQRAKKSIDLGAGTDLHTGLLVEIEAYNQLVPTQDRREGVNAFNEKRKPQFKGE